jgi:toxin-antitoxin system PIN domain toxin
MIAVDTNILVYAHREDSSWHESAATVVRELAEGRSAWAIPWPCLHEFLAIVTHPRIYTPPTPLPRAIDQVEAWLGSPRLVLLSEARDYWAVLRAAVKSGRVEGPKIHDARIAALCRQHGVRELWSADRDFSRFKELPVRNPLVITD